MTKIYFVRHGESIANAGAVTMEHDLIPLSALGKAQAEALAQYLDVNPSWAMVSKFVRASETARPFCARWGCIAEISPLLHEFSALDPAFIDGMTGAERRPIAAAYWQAAKPNVRHGPAAETFFEFSHRVDQFIAQLHEVPDRCVLFGHGIWFGLLCWKLIGFDVDNSESMKAFRRFQTGLPMPNCAVYELEGSTPNSWRWRADQPLMRRIAQIAG